MTLFFLVQRLFFADFNFLLPFCLLNHRREKQYTMGPLYLCNLERLANCIRQAGRRAGLALYNVTGSDVTFHIQQLSVLNSVQIFSRSIRYAIKAQISPVCYMLPSSYLVTLDQGMRPSTDVALKSVPRCQCSVAWFSEGNDSASPSPSNTLTYGPEIFMKMCMKVMSTISRSCHSLRLTNIRHSKPGCRRGEQVQVVSMLYLFGKYLLLTGRA